MTAPHSQKDTSDFEQGEIMFKCGAVSILRDASIIQGKGLVFPDLD